MSSFTERMLGASKLDSQTYEEVEHDKGAMTQALGVVVLSSLAAGIGAMGQAGLAMGLIAGTVAALIGWVVWAFLTWAIGTKLLPESTTEADMGQLLRTIGFASAPGLLRVLGIVPGIGPLIVFAANVWMLAAMVVGVRQALDYSSTWRAVGVCVIGWVIVVVLQVIVFAMIGPPAGMEGAGMNGGGMNGGG